MLKNKDIDRFFIDAANQLLNNGQRVMLHPKGRSMLPFLRGNIDIAILSKPEKIKKYDVVCFRMPGPKFIIHRVWDIQGDYVILMGDGNLGNKEICHKKDVIARVDEVIGPDGKHRRLDTPFQRAAARVWRWLLPFRRYLLAIYRRTLIRHIKIE